MDKMHAYAAAASGLNESPSEKEGKCQWVNVTSDSLFSLNESPSEKEGKFNARSIKERKQSASMKVPPKRKGNHHTLDPSPLPSSPQ